MTLEEAIKILNTLKPEVKSGFNPLIPNAKHIRGISIPTLRKIAKSIAKDNYKTFLDANPNQDFELEVIHSLVIGYAKDNIITLSKYFLNWANQIHDWAVCDALCQNFTIARKQKQYVYENIIIPLAKSSKEFHQRIAAVLILSHFLSLDSIDNDLTILNSIKPKSYYAQMGIAWAIATAMAKQRNKCMDFMKKNNLDTITYNKAIQKMLESFRITTSDKAILRNMKKH